MTQQVPSVGRIVHYRSYGTPKGEFSSTCRAAIITEVDKPGDPDSPVGICAINPTGIFFNQHIQHGDQPGQWHWPEFVPSVANATGA